MRNRPLMFATLLALGMCAGTAAAAPCAGFVDVDDTNPATAAFCGNVEWLKNRSITLGCTDTQHFCPGDSVSRLAMAAFMNRLGKALTPVILHKAAALGAVTVSASTDPGTLACATTDYLVEGFPRTARFRGNAYGVPTSIPSWLHAYWKYSTNQGATWTNVGTWGVDTWYGRDWANVATVATAIANAPPMPLVVGTTYRFGLFVSGIGASYPYNPIVCAIEVTIDNHNAATSPLDAD